MKQTPLYLIFASVFLVGCATTKSPTDMTQLQIRVNQMERRLEEREREIEELKFAMNNLSAQLDDSNSISFRDPIDDIDFSRATNTARKTSAQSPAKDDSIIRVNETPQRVQTALKAAGYYRGNIDGKMGSGSQQAIRAFQKDHNLKADGIVGRATWTELKNYLQ